MLAPAPAAIMRSGRRSEEHTSELQSLTNLVCRLLLEKKNPHLGKKKTKKKKMFFNIICCFFFFFGLIACQPCNFIGSFLFFFFNDTATTEIYTLSLHDALPISRPCRRRAGRPSLPRRFLAALERSEEHTSELQSRSDLVCRLLLEKKKNNS